jgi:phosphotransferase system enzyme I (PtsI)
MAPSALADVRHALSERTLDEARNLAGIALTADDAVGARNAVAEATASLPSHKKETTS